MGPILKKNHHVIFLGTRLLDGFWRFIIHMTPPGFRPAEGEEPLQGRSDAGEGRNGEAENGKREKKIVRRVSSKPNWQPEPAPTTLHASDAIAKCKQRCEAELPAKEAQARANVGPIPKAE
jgi:hypothetical protein